MTNVGRKPDFNLHAKMKTGGEKQRVGAAWVQEDGSIQIKLDPFVQLNGAAITGEGMWLTLYKNIPWEERQQEEKRPPAAAHEDLEDDIPF